MKGEDQQDQIDYKQELGLKKILYKYQNQNQQLRSQIKALSERLASILQKPKQEKKQVMNPIQQVQSKLLKQEMQKLYKQINSQIEDLKCNKDAIDERHQNKYIQVENKVKKQDKEIQNLKYKLNKYEQIDEGIILNTSLKNSKLLSFQPSLLNNKTLRSSTIRIQSYYQKYASLSDQLETTRKSIKALQRKRDSNDRNIAKKHLTQIDSYHENRNIQFGKKQEIVVSEDNKKKKSGVWGLDFTQQNYKMIKDEIEQLKKQRQIKLNSIKNQNIVLSNKINQLNSELEGVNKSVQIPPLPHMKRGSLNTTPLNLSSSRYVESPLRKSIKLDVGVAQFQRNNDKNYVQKKPRRVQWLSSKIKSGIQWNDSNVKSPITGINLWMQGHLLGIQFLHTMGDSSQHLHLMSKKVAPIQYRLSSNDYVQNIVLFLNDNLIAGLQLSSKNGRVDSFGQKNKAKKYDFGIKKGEKPVFSFGQFQVTNNNSEITKLGFQVI